MKYFFYLALIFLLSACYDDGSSRKISVYDQTERNYGKEVTKLAKKYSLPPEYLKALIVLECDGKLPAPSRFEQGVYESLKNCKRFYR